MGKKNWPKSAKKCQTFFLISTVRKLLDQSKKKFLEGLIINSPGIKMGQKNGQKVLKKCQKAPKYISP